MIRQVEAAGPLLSFVLIGFVCEGCSRTDQYPNRPITLVCPWAAGGGTDRVSRQIAQYLENELDVPVNVINAAGGQGVTGHARGLQARPDGYTLCMMTPELNMLHWRGLTDLSWQSCEPLMSLNEDPAALFVRTESPFKTITDLEEVVRASPGELKASGTANLGTWHLAMAGWLLSFDCQPTDVVWIPMRGAAPSLTELMSGGIDLVCCSVPEARTLLDGGKLLCLGVMADRRLDLPGLDQHPTLKEQGSDWTFTGWRGLGVPRETAPDVQKRLVTALQKIVKGESKHEGKTFPEYMDGEGFERTWRATDDFAAFLERSDATMGELLRRKELQGVGSGRIGPYDFPWVAGGLSIGSLLVIGSVAFRARHAGPVVEVVSRHPAAGSLSVNWITFVVVPLATAAYALTADTTGYIPIAAAILLVFSLLLGSPLRTAVSLAALASVAIYQLFTCLLRVPLPPGWLGW